MSDIMRGFVPAIRIGGPPLPARTFVAVVAEMLGAAAVFGAALRGRDGNLAHLLIRARASLRTTLAVRQCNSHSHCGRLARSYSGLTYSDIGIYYRGGPFRYDVRRFQRNRRGRPSRNPRSADFGRKRG